MSFETLRQTCTAQATFATPLGPVLAVRTAQGLAGLWFEGQQHHPGTLAAPLRADDPLLRRAADLLQRYFAGEPVAFDLPLDLHGTPFQRAVWQALLAIPAGKTMTYGALSVHVGNPAAVRAVGATGAIITTKAIAELHRTGGRYALVTMCIGGGQGIAAIFERV